MPTIHDLVAAIRDREGVQAAVVLGRDGLVIDAQALPTTDAEKKAQDLMEAIMSKQPRIIVKNVEAILADAAKTKWWCW